LPSRSKKLLPRLSTALPDETSEMFCVGVGTGVGDGTGAGDGLGKGDGDCACAGSDVQSTNKGANMRTAARALAPAIPLLLRQRRDEQPINAGSQKTENGSAASLKYHSII
jgi:hypothetical protein